MGSKQAENPYEEVSENGIMRMEKTEWRLLFPLCLRAEREAKLTPLD